MKIYDSKITLLCPVCKSSIFDVIGFTVICENCKSSFTKQQQGKAYVSIDLLVYQLYNLADDKTIAGEE